MMLGYAELEEIVDAIQKTESVTKIVTYLNRIGELEKVLKGAGLDSIFNPRENCNFQPYKNGKIVVLGDSHVKEEILIAICKESGIDKGRLELCLDYKKVEKYDIRKMYYNSNYSAILVGPSPHSGVGKGHSSSIIAQLEDEDGYPPVIRLTSGSKLKITKGSFKNAIKVLVDEEIILVS